MTDEDPFLELDALDGPYVALVLDADGKTLAAFNLDGEDGGVLSVEPNDYPGAVALRIADGDDLLEHEQGVDPNTEWCDCDDDVMDGVKLGRHFRCTVPGTDVIVHYHRDYEREVVTVLRISGGREG